MPVAVDYARIWKSVKIRMSQRGPLLRVLEESHIRIRLRWANNDSVPCVKKSKKVFSFLDAELILMEPHGPKTRDESLRINRRVCAFYLLLLSSRCYFPCG